MISKDVFIHETAIVDDGAKIGSGTKIWHFSHVMGSTVIGERCSFGQNVFVANKVSIGNNVKVQNNVSIYEGVVLEDDVFCCGQHGIYECENAAKCISSQYPG